MACPYFYPLARVEGRPEPARAPLLGCYAGECRASATTPAPEDRLESCNFGYARGACPLFPARSAAEAVRFSWHGGRVLFVFECDASPVSHGIIDDTAPPTLARQAEVFRSGMQRLGAAA